MDHISCASFLIPHLDSVKAQCSKGSKYYHRSPRDLRRKTFRVRSRYQAFSDGIGAEIVQHLGVRMLKRFQDQFVHVHLSLVPFVDILVRLINCPIVIVKAPGRLLQ